MQEGCEYFAADVRHLRFTQTAISDSAGLIVLSQLTVSLVFMQAASGGQAFWWCATDTD